MGLLDAPRCPQCNSEIAMGGFWRVDESPGFRVIEGSVVQSPSTVEGA
jgi:hypothetical protein